jgi:hypothetical protein
MLDLLPTQFSIAAGPLVRLKISAIIYYMVLTNFDIYATLYLRLGERLLCGEWFCGGALSGSEKV